MIRYRYIYDQFTQIVADTAVRSGIPCFYQYGPPMEIIENLRAMTKDPTQTERKYPLIALFTDFRQRQGRIPGIESEVSLHFIIATLTDKNYTAPERIELNFKPILHPIFDAFAASIFKSGYYQMQTEKLMSRDIYDRLSWGKNGLYDATGNVFEDMIDCIEIVDLELKKFNHQNC